jgi:serine/threonine protein kinase
VLVKKSIDPAGIEIKVADFGFSSFEAVNGNAVKVARTIPWEAPEWHSRHFSLENAKKLDIYSFGLLCLWILFRDRKITEFGDPAVTLGEAMLGENPDATLKLQSMKEDPYSVINCALRLLQETDAIDEGDRAKLERAFRLTLSWEPANRAKSMEELVELLGIPEDTEE